MMAHSLLIPSEAAGLTELNCRGERESILRAVPLRSLVTRCGAPTVLRRPFDEAVCSTSTHAIPMIASPQNPLGIFAALDQQAARAADVRSHLVQLKSHPDPVHPVKNHFNSNEKPNHPKPRDRPIRQDETAHDCCNDSAQGLPTPARQMSPQRGDKFIQSADQKEYGHHESPGLGADHRSSEHQ